MIALIILTRLLNYIQLGFGDAMNSHGWWDFGQQSFGKKAGSVIY
jgi:hypothetical protein